MGMHGERFRIPTNAPPATRGPFAFQIVCPKCGWGDLSDYDRVQGKIFLAYCFRCEPHGAAACAYEQSPKVEQERKRAFGRA